MLLNSDLKISDLMEYPVLTHEAFEYSPAKSFYEVVTATIYW